jgi:hypothetical protein
MYYLLRRCQPVCFNLTGKNMKKGVKKVKKIKKRQRATAPCGRIENGKG